jgi:hypothetical protein
VPLAATLETALSTYFKRRVQVAAIRRAPCPYWSDFHTEKISVELASGKSLDVFFKDFGFSSVPRGEQLRVGRREIDTYRFLAEAKVRGLPRLYGWVWNEEQERYWLFLEDVGNWRLQDGIFRDWIRAVRWLGRFHGRFLGQENYLRDAVPGLPQYNWAYYTRVAMKADRVLQESASIDDHAARFRKRDRERLRPVLEFFPKVANHLVAEERTLIHGDCFSQNVLLRVNATNPNGSPGVCFVDWETVATGPGAIDLMALLLWWTPPKSDLLIEHYLDALRRTSGRRIERRRFYRTLECVWVHNTLDNIAHMDWSEGRYGLSRRYMGLSYCLKRVEQFMRTWPA